MMKQLLKIMLVLTVLCGMHGAPCGGWLSGAEAHAATVTLPKTGQTGCWDVNGAVVVCATDSLANGQDGKLQKGVAWPNPRFIDNKQSDGVTSNGTITDDLTGLIWLKNANCFGAQTWQNSLVSANTLAVPACTLSDGSVASDWRLPNVTELESLVDAQQSNPSLPTGHPFAGVQSNWYWSSSTYANYAGSAWGVSMFNGFNYGLKTNGYYVWPVRGGQFGDSVTLALPVSKNFGNVAVSGSSSQTFTISNSGASSRLQVNAMVLSGADAGQYTLNVGDGSGGTCGSKTPIIAPGGACTVSVAFSPTSAGVKTANLRISGSDVNTPNVDIALSGGLPTYTIGTSVVGGNSNCTISNITAGYHLATFTDDTVDKLASVVANSYNITNVIADHAIAGTFAINNYTVIYTSNGGSTVSSQSVAYNTQTTAPAAPTKTGSTFAGWYSDAGLTAAFVFTTAITADNTLYAKWTINNYTVSFTSNGGNAVSNQSVAYSTVATEPTAPTKTGSTFAGWYSDAGLTAAFVFTTAITADTTLYAKWTAIVVPTITYTVTPSAGTGSTMLPATAQTITSGATTSFTITPVTGYGILSVTGCNGTLSGTTYTTGATTGDCLVTTTTVKRNSNSGVAADPTIADALKALQAYSATVLLTPTEQIRYDIAPLSANGVPQGNGLVDIADVIMILRRSVGIGSW